MKTFSRVAIVLVGLAGMTGLAAAQPKAADPKMQPKMEPKPADKAPAPMAEMKPPAELAEMAKASAGTWRCKGQGMDMATNKMVDMTATLKNKLELAGWWMHVSFESKMGKQAFGLEEYTTFDPASKKWKRVMVETGGGWSTGESAGLKDNKIDWELTSHSAMGEGIFRDHEDVSDPKAGAKFWGEFSTDKGKTWTKVYEMACKK
ncbi:MAG TPA: hypothetical protein VFT22_12200 [Kofleriaceae bacterium]|nr:hypothetical protein [Kofleriaceae bacterium]